MRSEAELSHEGGNGDVGGDAIGAGMKYTSRRKGVHVDRGNVIGLLGNIKAPLKSVVKNLKVRPISMVAYFSPAQLVVGYQ